MTHDDSVSPQRASEQRFRRMVEHLPVGAAYIVDGRIQMNAAAESITGYQRHELPTLDAWFAALYPDGASLVRQLYESDKATGFPGPSLVRLARKDAEERLIEFQGYASDTDEFWLLRDVTEQQRNERALQESEERFDLAVRASADGIWDWININEDREWWSPRYYELLGYEPGELVPKLSTFRELLHPDDVADTLQAMEAHLNDDVRYDVEYRLRTKSGEYRWFRARAAVLRDEHGQPLRMTGCLEDIHNRKTLERQREAAEAALRREHELSESMINTAQNIVLVLDTEGRITRYNRYMEELSGWRLDEVQGRDWFDTFLPQVDGDQVRKVFEQSLRGDRSTGEVNSIATKDGREREIEWHHAPLTDGDGGLIGLLCTGQDITERKRLEREILEIAAAEQRRIGHELHDNIQQQLTGLGLIVQHLSETLAGRSAPEAEQATRLARGVSEVATHVDLLSRGLLPVEVDAQGLMSALEKLRDDTDKINGISCSFSCPKPVGLANTFVATNVYRIAQEALNNALKHSRADHIAISLDGSDDSITLKVRDNGIGIREQKPPDSGMGLQIMGYRASLIDATLRIEQAADTGTLVMCSLPLDSQCNPSNHQQY